MNLAIIGDEIDQDLDNVISTVQECDYKGIEVRSVWNIRPDQLNDEQLDSIRYSVEKKGLSIVGFDSPVFKTAIPKTIKQIEEARDSFLHAVHQARILKAQFIRVFSFYRKEQPEPKEAGRIMKGIIEDIIPKDIMILVETGMRTNTPSIVQMIDLLEVLNNNRVGVLWDPGNTVYSGFNKNPFPNDYKLGRDVIKHIHVKDSKGQKEYVNIGDGDVPWKDIVKFLTNDGYDGWFSLETHWRPDRIIPQQIRDNPWYDEFSRGGYEASLKSMKEFASYFK